MQGRSNLELTFRKLIPNPIKVKGGRHRIVVDTNQSETYILKSNSANVNKMTMTAKYGEFRMDQLPGVIPQPFHTNEEAGEMIATDALN